MKIFLERINFFKNNHEHFFVKTKINKINGKKKENLTKNTEEEKKKGENLPRSFPKAQPGEMLIWVGPYKNDVGSLYLHL